jgi:hypothetical protein
MLPQKEKAMSNDTPQSAVSDPLATTPLKDEELDISLDELLDKEPLSLSVEERGVILQTYRESFDRWNEEEITSKSRGKRADTKKGLKKGARVKKKIDLTELDLEI